MGAAGQKERLRARMAERGLLAQDGETSIYGLPTWRPVPACGEPGAPQALMDAGARQRNVVALAKSQHSTGEDRCAGWIQNVLARELGFRVEGDALALYNDYCKSSDLAALKVGMVVGVPSVPYNVNGRKYGHVGLYVGDGQIMDFAGMKTRCLPLGLWLSAYGVAAEPRWGWLGSIGLDA